MTPDLTAKTDIVSKELEYSEVGVVHRIIGTHK